MQPDLTCVNIITLMGTQKFSNSNKLRSLVLGLHNGCLMGRIAYSICSGWEMRREVIPVWSTNYAFAYRKYGL